MKKKLEENASRHLSDAPKRWRQPPGTGGRALPRATKPDFFLNFFRSIRRLRCWSHCRNRRDTQSAWTTRQNTKFDL